MNAKLMNFRPTAASTTELAYRLKQIEGLPFLKDFRPEYRVPRSVKVPHNKSPGYKSCCASWLNGRFEWRQTGGNWSSYSFDLPLLYHPILLRVLSSDTKER